VPTFSAKPLVSVGSFPVDAEPFRQPIGAARTDATVVFAASACRHCVLDEAIGAPHRAGHERNLRDGVCSLPLLLGQRNNRRTVIAQIVAHAGTDSPFFSQLVGDVQFDRPGLEAPRTAYRI
jgi:hypothetical protein